MLRCPRFILPGVSCQATGSRPPFLAGDVTMPYDDHREMVDPTWVAHPGVEA